MEKKTENNQAKPFIGILTKVNLLVCHFEKKCVAASETLLIFTLNWKTGIPFVFVVITLSASFDGYGTETRSVYIRCVTS